MPRALLWGIREDCRTDHAVKNLFTSRLLMQKDASMDPQDTAAPFDYNTIPEGFYQQVLETGNPIRRAWHLQKFERVVECLPTGRDRSILDIGCFAGSFLSLLSEERFGRQLGVDILEKQVAYANRRFATAYRSFRYIRASPSLSASMRRSTVLR